MGVFPVGLEHERGDSMMQVTKVWWDGEKLMAEPIDLASVYKEAAHPAPVQGPDWKSEYLKSVESGCITLDELRETLAELDATNRQVEILSDALAESRREVAALKAVQEPVGSMGIPLSCGKPLCAPGDHHPLCKLATPPAAQQAVPDAIIEAGESPDYRDGWNDCRAEMLKGMKP
jgi:hypothetical protein